MLTQAQLTSFTEEINRFRRQFLAMNSSDIMELFDTEEIRGFFDEAAQSLLYNPRNRIWTLVSTLFLFVKQVLVHGNCADAVKLMQAERVSAGLVPCSSNTSAYCQARERLPETLPRTLMRHVADRLDGEGRYHWRWRGRVVKLADGSTLSMSDTPANQRVYPHESNQREGLGFPLARIGIIASLDSGAILDFGIAPYTGKGTGETALFRQISPNALESGDLCLLDKYYESFWLAADLSGRHIDFLCPLRANRKLDWTSGTPLRGDGNDRVFQLPKPDRPDWMTPDDYLAQPASVTVRIFRIYGRTYVTSLLDSRRYRKNALRKLYNQRWHIELDLRVIKRVLDMEPLRGQTPESVGKEIAVSLLAYNLIRLLMVQAGIAHQIWPRYLSFQNALSTFRAFAEVLTTASGWASRMLWDKVLEIVASKTVGHRKGRSEPRACKRRHTKRYPYLNKPRRIINEELAHLSQFS